MAKVTKKPKSKEELKKEMESIEQTKAMEELVKLEKKLGYTFTPFIHSHSKGSFTYLAPVKTPEEKAEGTGTKVEGLDVKVD